jgi:hypothetical protein
LSAAAWLYGAHAIASPPLDPARVQSLLTAMEADLLAVREERLSPDGVVRASSEVRGYVSQLSLALGGGSALVSIQVAMRAHADALDKLANDPNPIQAAASAADLLNDITRLRAALAAP